MSTPLTFLCWLWTTKYQPTKLDRDRFSFTPATVRVLRNMIRRHYKGEHRFICITDQQKAIDPDIETMPLWSEFGELGSPHGPRNPSCYRRLRVFSREASQWFGERLVSVDLDVVITADITSLFDREEDFVCWGDVSPRSFYNGSLWMLKTGSRPQVYENFDPRRSPREALAAGRYGSDQAWLSHCLGPGEAKWGTKDGVYSYRNHIDKLPRPGILPDGARIVVFHGSHKPWGPRPQRLDWVRSHYV